MGSINRDILVLAWPAIVSNITTPLLGLVDVAIVGHVGASELAAIAVGGTLVNTLYWIFNFLRMGTGGLTAQAYGAQSSRAQRTVLAQSLMIAIGVGGLINGAYIGLRFHYASHQRLPVPPPHQKFSQQVPRNGNRVADIFFSQKL